MAGVDVFTDATVQDRQPKLAATLRRFCRAQPELAGLVIGAVLSAPLVLVLLNT